MTDQESLLDEGRRRWESLEVTCVDCGHRFKPWPTNRCSQCDTDEGSVSALGRVGGREAVAARRRFIEESARNA